MSSSSQTDLIPNPLILRRPSRKVGAVTRKWQLIEREDKKMTTRTITWIAIGVVVASLGFLSVSRVFGNPALGVLSNNTNPVSVQWVTIGTQGPVLRSFPRRNATPKPSLTQPPAPRLTATGTPGPIGPPVIKPKANPHFLNAAWLVATSATGPVGPPNPRPTPTPTQPRPTPHLEVAL